MGAIKKMLVFKKQAHHRPHRFPMLTPQALSLTTDSHHWAPKSQSLISKIFTIAQDPITDLSLTPNYGCHRPHPPPLNPQTTITNSTDKPSIIDPTEFLIKSNQNHLRDLSALTYEDAPDTSRKNASESHFRFQSGL